MVDKAGGGVAHLLAEGALDVAGTAMNPRVQVLIAISRTARVREWVKLTYQPDVVLVGEIAVARIAVVVFLDLVVAEILLVVEPIVTIVAFIPDTRVLGCIIIIPMAQGVHVLLDCMLAAKAAIAGVTFPVVIHRGAFPGNNT